MQHHLFRLFSKTSNAIYFMEYRRFRKWITMGGTTTRLYGVDHKSAVDVTTPKTGSKIHIIIVFSLGGFLITRQEAYKLPMEPPNSTAFSVFFMRKSSRHPRRNSHRFEIIFFLIITLRINFFQERKNFLKKYILGADMADYKLSQRCEVCKHSFESSTYEDWCGVTCIPCAGCRKNFSAPRGHRVLY